jgi:hypothetical protein
MPKRKERSWIWSPPVAPTIFIAYWNYQNTLRYANLKLTYRLNVEHYCRDYACPCVNA